MLRIASLSLSLILLAVSSCAAQGAARNLKRAASYIGRDSVSQKDYPQPQVVTPDVPHLPYTMQNGVKVFDLTAEVVERELLPGSDMGPAKQTTVWGYNGSVPGPTIEVNEGDHIRVIFHNKLAEDTTIHWHGLEIPIAMDGMPFISQPPVKPGGQFVYEFTVHQNGTYFYHSHGAMQEMMGMIGLFIIHPKKSFSPAVQKDFGLLVQEFAILPNNKIANSMAMEYNWLTINGKSAPATTPLICKQGDRVRIRIANMGMDHHPIHLHGYQFYITGTEGGRVPETAWYPGNTVLVGVAQARDVEFDAKYVGDFMLHCHLPHHMMNNMVSSVGPLSHVGQGMHTGMGQQEGMGIVRQDAAGSETLGPGLGRGMGISADREQNTSNGIGHTLGDGQPVPNASLDTLAPLGSDANSKTAAGYPQDATMMMPMDAAVAKPENNGLAKGWSGALQGMMTLVRVLPAAKYDQLMADIKAHRIDAGQLSGMDMPGMKMDSGKKMDKPGMKMDMPGMKMDMPGTKGHVSELNTSAKHSQQAKRKLSPAKLPMEKQMKMDPNMKM